ncbi:ABC-type antimicrobial peptide transport system, ATpase component [Clostridium aceticum]|uniref:ABC-type antimicrobial peptide transport system, ATpase component n=1 Tax=Clostridium aceticum TaxID=84022 RepID=A0A0D8I932_9CLOT|nr:ABC transporter ATP-binding protein [Clostridium aceticum]AKL95657.1 ABC-type antimicrobial peptide transport system, ATpase component [Clostridium aceticum]KJF26778.1 ABC transporter ATP-binding protein [Clostridium aceticum]
MSEIMISLRDIKKVYKSMGEEVQALHSITLDIKKGESVSVMGHSGSGKSTLLSIIGALNPPTSGIIEIDGIDIYKLSQERRADFRREYLGFVFQQFQLIPYLTAHENVMLPLTTTKRSKKEKWEMAEDALQRVGLANKMKRLPNQLSGGEQERVAIARAIVNAPPLLLADEPTGSLDTKTGDEIMELFQKLREDGLTILMVTHNPDNTRYMGRTIMVKDGRILSDQEGVLQMVSNKKN